MSDLLFAAAVACGISGAAGVMIGFVLGYGAGHARGAAAVRRIREQAGDELA